MSILTSTMSNIKITQYYVQSPLIACVINIKEDGSIKCDVHKMWVEKGTGKVIVTFRNHSDFRTLIQLDVGAILMKVFENCEDLGLVIDVCMEDNENVISECTREDFSNGWSICNDALMVKENLFKLSEFNLTLTLIEDEDDDRE